MTVPAISDDRRRRLLPLFVALLLAAQLLGLVHRIRHGVPERATAAAAGEAVTAAADAFGHAPGDASGCRLYDALCAADAAPLPLPALPASAPRAVSRPWHATWQLAAQAAGFLARGPPSFR